MVYVFIWPGWFFVFTGFGAFLLLFYTLWRLRIRLDVKEEDKVVFQSMTAEASIASETTVEQQFIDEKTK